MENVATNAAIATTPTELQDLGGFQQRLDRREAARQIYWYDIPKGIATSTGVTRIGLVELTSDEYLMAANRCQNNLGRLSLELVKESVHKVDTGTMQAPSIRSINTGDGSADMFWNQMRKGMSKLQSLANMAYGKIHNNTSDEVEYFLASEETTAG